MSELRDDTWAISIHGQLDEGKLVRRSLVTAHARFGQRLLALSELKPERDEAPAFVAMLRDDIEMAMRGKGTHVVPVLGLAARTGASSVSEYVRGVRLSDLRDHNPSIPIPIASRIVLDVALALAELQESLGFGDSLSVVHRHLLPSSVIVGLDGVTRLDNHGPLHTRSFRSPAGLDGRIDALRYLAPEAAEGLSTDARSNHFTWSTLAWELLVGSRAFDGEDNTTTLKLVRSVSLVPPDTHLPKALGAAIAHSHARDPNARHTSAADLAQAFQGAAESTLGLASAAQVRHFIRHDAGPKSARVEGLVARTCNELGWPLPKPH